MENVRLVKLASGEEVIFKAGEENNNSVIMKNPITLHVVPQGQDQYGLQLYPYSPSCPEGDHKLYNSQVVSECVNIPDGLIKAYIQRTTGIEIASAVDAFANLR